MPQMLLILLLVVCLFWKDCEVQISRAEATVPRDGPGIKGNAFFALRSCHQLLNADKGEFFSPDYLCSNPPLWCNWTIQVDPGKRIYLQMEDFTPDDTCHLKQDQIHVDEPVGHSGGHRILQRCWREAKYTSSSNTLQVVLLIGEWPSPTYRGFYGRYQVFGPPVVYNPQESFRERLVDFIDTGPVLEGDHMESDLPQEHSDLTHGSNDELPLEAEEAADTEVWEDSPVEPLTAVPTVPASTHRTSLSSRGTPYTTLNRSIIVSPQQRRDTSHKFRPEVYSPTAGQKEDAEGADEANTQSWRGNTSADRPEPAAHHRNQTEQAHPSTVELLSDPKGNPTVRNQSVNPHLPGDFLFEVAVEVDFKHDSEDSWDNHARSLLLSVKSLVREKLEAVHLPLSMSSKRIKRLNAGVLYILWLRVASGPSSSLVHSSVPSLLQGLMATSLRNNHRQAAIMSVSTADVNECGTQLVLCDTNADCVNLFGSYSCHCRLGFRDESRLGSGGTVCVDLRGCSSGLSPETKGVYVLFFLLSSSMLMLLVVAAVLYRRHHRGAFMVHCHSSSSMCPPDINNNHHLHDEDYSCPAETNLPPPLPARGPRAVWPQGKQRCPAVDLPLLRFSSLQPSDGYVEKQESGKM